MRNEVEVRKRLEILHDMQKMKWERKETEHRIESAIRTLEWVLGGKNGM